MTTLVFWLVWQALFRLLLNLNTTAGSIVSALLGEHLLEDLADPVTNLGCTRITAQVLCAHTVIQHLFDGLFNENSLFGTAERVSEHHGGREDGADGVGDTLAGNVGSGAYLSARCSHQNTLGTYGRACRVPVANTPHSPAWYLRTSQHDDWTAF